MWLLDIVFTALITGGICVGSVFLGKWMIKKGKQSQSLGWGKLLKVGAWVVTISGIFWAVGILWNIACVLFTPGIPYP